MAVDQIIFICLTTTYSGIIVVDKIIVIYLTVTYSDITVLLLLLFI